MRRETIVFAYHPEAAVPWALIQHFDNYQQQSDPLETVIFIDGLKRALQTKKDGAVSTGSSSKDKTKDMMIVSGRVIFDFAGRAVEQYYPVTENLGKQGVFNPAFDTVQPTRTSHDVMDRVLQTVIPDNTAVTYAYGFGSDREGKIRFQTQVTDANQKSKVNYKDVRGLITSVKEFNKGETIWTSYQYDPMKQIVQVMDNQKNITSAKYDLGGRRTHLDSPDMGLTETVYDPASNAVEKITANLRATGKAIAYDYTFNRLRQLIYPDSEVLTYAYNSGGLAQSASGKKGDYDYPYLKALTYDKFEQRVFMRQGNGAETDYTYNPLNRRLAMG